MAREGKENQNGLSFRGGFIYWPDEDTKHGSAKCLEWQLIEAALRLEPVPWMDGFVVLASWHEKEQRIKDYIEMFRSIWNRANGKLDSLGVKGL
jgi:hypothetical protein